MNDSIPQLQLVSDLFRPLLETLGHFTASFSLIFRFNSNSQLQKAQFTFKESHSIMVSNIQARITMTHQNIQWNSHTFHSLSEINPTLIFHFARFFLLAQTKFNAINERLEQLII